ncbi:hypothetical protein N9Z01_00500 [Flavobacteriaceae bacterium]|nr:hypothetical protein [Flavobacteriaceae bacterium]
MIVPAFGQQRKSYRWEATALEQISLSLPFANSISVLATKTNFVEVEYKTEGEYQKAVVLSRFIDENTVRIEEQLNPSFSPFQDKLSAHKVMATTLEISYPEKSSLSLMANSARVDLDGLFPQLAIQLDEGSLYLNSSFSRGKIKTNSAHIYAEGLENPVFALSKKGKITGQTTAKQNATLLLESKRGNIFINSNRK